MDKRDREWISSEVRKWIRRCVIVVVAVLILAVLGLGEHWLRMWILRARLLPWVSAARVEAWSVVGSAVMFWAVWSWAAEKIRDGERVRMGLPDGTPIRERRWEVGDEEGD